MIVDILILIFLVIRINKYARLRGQAPFKWGALLVLNWYMFQLLGISLVVSVLNIQLTPEFMMSSPGYMVLLSIFGLGCGFIGYFLTRFMMDRQVV